MRGRPGLAGCKFANAHLGQRLRKLDERLATALSAKLLFARQVSANTKAAYRWSARSPRDRADPMGWAGHISPAELHHAEASVILHRMLVGASSVMNRVVDFGTWRQLPNRLVMRLPCGL